MSRPYNFPLKVYPTRSQLRQQIKISSPTVTPTSIKAPRSMATSAMSEAADASTSTSGQGAAVMAAATPSTHSGESLSPQTFAGSSGDDAISWLTYLRRYVTFKKYGNDDVVRIFPLFLRGTAADWYDQLPADVQNSVDQLEQACIARFTPSDLMKWVKVSDMFSRAQRSGESVDDYIVQVQKLAKSVNLTDDTLIRYAVLKGLRPNIRSFVLQSGANTMADVIVSARIAEQTMVTDLSLLSEIRQDRHVAELEHELRKLASTVERMSVNSVRSSTPINTRAGVSDQNMSDNQRGTRRAETRYRPSSFPRTPAKTPITGTPSRTGTRPDTNNAYKCFRCGKSHPFFSQCPARTLRCFNCGTVGHIRAMCRQPLAANNDPPCRQSGPSLGQPSA